MYCRVDDDGKLVPSLIVLLTLPLLVRLLVESPLLVELTLLVWPIILNSVATSTSSSQRTLFDICEIDKRSLSPTIKKRNKKIDLWINDRFVSRWSQSPEYILLYVLRPKSVANTIKWSYKWLELEPNYRKLFCFSHYYTTKSKRSFVILVGLCFKHSFFFFWFYDAAVGDLPVTKELYLWWLLTICCQICENRTIILLWLNF